MENKILKFWFSNIIMIFLLLANPPRLLAWLLWRRPASSQYVRQKDCGPFTIQRRNCPVSWCSICQPNSHGPQVSLLPVLLRQSSSVTWVPSQHFPSYIFSWVALRTTRWLWPGQHSGLTPLSLGTSGLHKFLLFQIYELACIKYALTHLYTLPQTSQESCQEGIL